MYLPVARINFKDIIQQARRGKIAASRVKKRNRLWELLHGNVPITISQSRI